MRVNNRTEPRVAHSDAREILNTLVSDLYVPLTQTLVDGACQARRARENLRRLARVARTLGQLSFCSVVIRVAERLDPHLREGEFGAREAALLRRLAHISQRFLNDSAKVAAATSLVELLGSECYPAIDRREQAYLLDGMIEEADLRAAHDESSSVGTNRCVCGLPSTVLDHAMLCNRLEEMLAVTEQTQESVGVLSIGLVGVEDIVDSFGAADGHAVLACLVAELDAAVAPAGTLARVGTDHFVVLLGGVTAANLNDKACRLLEVIGRCRSAGDHLVSLSARIGMAVSGKHGHVARELLANADVALHDARGRRVHTIQFFTPRMRQAALRRVKLEAQLRAAIEHGSFEMHYQPKVSLSDGRLCGVEALVRWRRGRGALVPPSEFIPIAEQSDLIVRLGDWVIDSVCRQMGQWSRECALDVPVAINLSPVQLCARQTRERIERALADYGLSPRMLELEVTESAFAQDTAAALRCLNELSELGVRVAIDDFGTGYSNLSQLIQLPLSAIKIDKSLIAGIATHKQDAVIARAIIDIARTLGAHVVAEGVETEQQRDMLREVGCDQYQGFLVAKPMKATRLRVWAEQRGCELHCA